MQKINTLYLRDKENPKWLTREVDPSCQWVLDGEGVATEKFDGSACLIHEGQTYRRHRVKPGKMKPEGWSHWNFEEPEASGHGWAVVLERVTADQYHIEAMDLAYHNGNRMLDGTYELVGPKLQDNPYNLKRHLLWRHGSTVLSMLDTSHEGLGEYLEGVWMEGIVWHHPDGRMAKIKRRDFGLPWPTPRDKVPPATQPQTPEV